MSKPLNPLLPARIQSAPIDLPRRQCERERVKLRRDRGREGPAGDRVPDGTREGSRGGGVAPRTGALPGGRALGGTGLIGIIIAIVVILTRVL